MKIADAFSGKNAVVGVLVLALLAQMPHAQYVFFSNSHDATWFSWLQSWGAAIALEVAVLVFVIRSNTRVSWGFAVFSITVNLMYYYDVPYIAPLLLSAGLPVAIALYSHEIADNHDDARAAPAQQKKHNAVSVVQPAVHGDAQDDALVIDAKVRALQLHSEGIAPAEIARIVQGKESTVRSWIRRSNGAAKVVS